MHFELAHPADQIIMMMERIYGYGMTTTSGGNLSIRDENGDIWITPAGVDKGALTREDVVCVKPGGTSVGIHAPSSELPFHERIYRARPDLKAVLHAHPPALVAFSIVRQIPNLHLLPNDYRICGEVGMAEYALPGSERLGRNIADVFARGINTVMLENHGVVIGGSDLFEAFKAFETLEFCARLELKARRIGEPVALTPEQLAERLADTPQAEAFVPAGFSAKERGLRREMCRLIHRAYHQKLFTSTQGTFSQRIDGDSFIITPFDQDRKYLGPEDLVRVDGGRVEAGKAPSRSVRLHQWIYDKQPHVNSIIIAHPPNIMAFAVTAAKFDSRTIPESYILLRGMPKLPYGAAFRTPEATAERFTPDTPIALMENECVIAVGHSLLNAFDRLEVAEYSAKAVISAASLGGIVVMDQDKIREIDEAFKL
ncbi:L-fuculose phosphate aldolase [Paenibacillus konkukensis]|uniref:L-fuculose phosphate aldolase n=1 Tax=Paenibacillus konkukensis TaxID=2020716 RepID=A0ABY4RTW6_9BACL|nr:class II aldolase/adducin family protein [Paenibacillus konkukensis]UQZ85608.1 L-fuculose phosphate aldolase [Paenibacillus konkukensis]